MSGSQPVNRRRGLTSAWHCATEPAARIAALRDPLEVAAVAASIANILEWLSDFGRMREEASRALHLIEPLLPKDGLSTGAVLAAYAGGQYKEAETLSKLQEIVSNLQQIAARANRSLGNYAEAERQFREVMPLVPDFAHPAIWFQLAAIRLGAGQAQEALDAFDALEPAFTGLLRPKLGVLLKYRADALLALGRAPEALTAVDASLSELEQQRDPDALWKAQWTRARVLEALGRGAEALEAASHLPVLSYLGSSDECSARIEIGNPGSEAARAQLLATEESRRTVILTLVSQVAASYVQLLDYDQQLTITRATLETRQESVRINGLRFKAGVISEMDYQQAVAEYQNAAVQVPLLERLIAHAMLASWFAVGRAATPALASPAPPGGVRAAGSC